MPNEFAPNFVDCRIGKGTPPYRVERCTIMYKHCPHHPDLKWVVIDSDGWHLQHFVEGAMEYIRRVYEIRD